jgi:hypothetical protein
MYSRRFNLSANLDPHQILDVGATDYALNTYDNLYRYEDNPPKMRPWLAESHTVSGDGLVWDFKLRQGVKFHDGSELTADDVVYSVQRLLAIGKAGAVLAGLEGWLRLVSGSLFSQVPAGGNVWPEEAARLIVADSPDIWIYNQVEVCGLANRVQGFRHCPVGSGGGVRWMHLAA